MAFTFRDPVWCAWPSTHLLDPATTQKSLPFSFRMKATHTSEKKNRLGLWVLHIGARVTQVWFTHLPAGIQAHVPNSQMSERQTPVYSKVRHKLSSSVWSWVLLQSTIKFIKQREEEPLAWSYRSHCSAGVCVQGRAFSTNWKRLKSLWSCDLESCFLSLWPNLYVYFLHERGV